MIKDKDKNKDKDIYKDKDNNIPEIRTEYKMISFHEFLQLNPDEFAQYESIGKLLKSDDWGVSNVMKWDFLTVKEIQNKFINGFTYDELIEIVQDLTGYSRKKIINKLWIDVFRFFKFVVDSIEFINEQEKKLYIEPDADEANAGIEMFNQFGYFITIDRLAEGNPLNYDAIGKMEYSIIFSKLLLNKVDMQFMKNYQRIINKNLNR